MTVRMMTGYFVAWSIILFTFPRLPMGLIVRHFDLLIGMVTCRYEDGYYERLSIHEYCLTA